MSGKRRIGFGRFGAATFRIVSGTPTPTAQVCLLHTTIYWFATTETDQIHKVSIAYGRCNALTLLERALKKAKAPFGLADVEEFFRLYGSLIHLMVERNAEGQIVAFAVLLPPARLLGRTTCQLLLLGSDGTVDRRHFERVKTQARLMGADTMIGTTWRNANALARMSGGVVDSVNVRWDLTKMEDVDGGSIALSHAGAGGLSDRSGPERPATGNRRGEGTEAE